MNTRAPGAKVRKLSMYLFGNTFVRKKKTPASEGAGEEEVQQSKQSTSSMLDKLTQHWYIDNTARMCTDVPRLVARVHVKVASGVDIWKHVDVEQSDKTHHVTIDLIKALLRILEEDSIADDIIKKIDDAAAEQEKNNNIPEEYLKTILEICGRTSRVYRIMKCLHQDYVLIGTTEFKLNFMKAHMMKDVRTDDGWKIMITLADYIQVVHVRKEQSIDMPGQENNHFDITYGVSMTFDRNMDEMTAAQLKISELSTHPNMDEKFRKEIEQLFGNGNLIVQ